MNMFPSDEKPKTADIYAAQKIIADISSGLYRSPAAALKELVSNAYDADATEAIINTDVPHFRDLVIRDNGTGMRIEEFLNVMMHIGGSKKRIINDQTPGGRKIIGRIGIGMLAVAQLGFHFFVSSSTKGTASRFVAEVDLAPFHKDDAALQSMGRLKDDDQVLIGAIKYVENIPEDEGAHYTVITIPDVRKGLISEITGDIRQAMGASEKLSIKRDGLINSFDQIIDLTRSASRMDMEVDSYYYMLWELAQICPLNYSMNTPFDLSERDIDGSNAVEIPSVPNFMLSVDGIELKRPQLFPSKRALKYESFAPKVYPITYDRNVSGRQLKFHGYIYAQKPRIDPEEFRGVHIRIRNVGIGKYDRTWLGYPFDEGIKFGQISGEIFVDDGLEQALNIDRDSFRETDIHYQSLRAYIWEKLRTEVFPDFKRRQKAFSKEKKNEADSLLDQQLESKLEQLPTPMNPSTLEYVPKVITPNIGDWIEVSEDILRLDKEKWKKFTEENLLTSQQAQERFIRVLKVLVSTELLSALDGDEINPLLEALAIAVQ